MFGILMVATEPDAQRRRCFLSSLRWSEALKRMGCAGVEAVGRDEAGRSVGSGSWETILNILIYILAESIFNKFQDTDFKMDMRADIMTCWTRCEKRLLIREHEIVSLAVASDFDWPRTIQLHRHHRLSSTSMNFVSKVRKLL